MSEKKLSGRIALVTGASRGVGAAVARLYAREGAHVILLARSKDGLEEVDDQIRAEGGEATLMPFDLKNTDDLEAIGPTIAERFGVLDIFVANAGVLGTLTPVSHSKIKDWKETWTVNVLANVQMIRSLEPLLKKSEAGRVIAVGSGMGLEPTGFWGEYGVSKAAEMFLFQTWAQETATTAMRINIARPGLVDTEMLKTAYPGGTEELGRPVRTPDEVAPLFVELAMPSCLRHGEIATPEDYNL